MRLSTPLPPWDRLNTIERNYLRSYGAVVKQKSLNSISIFFVNSLILNMPVAQGCVLEPWAVL
jgi:hypothetical protein